MCGKAISSSPTGSTAKFDTRCIRHSGFGRSLRRYCCQVGWRVLRIVGFGVLFFGRVGREEKMMAETFGDRYREYVARTTVYPADFLTNVSVPRRRFSAISATSGREVIPTAVNGGSVNCVAATVELFNPSWDRQEIIMLKILIVGTATFALLGAAAAADLPHPQPVTENAPIGKMPIGKMPIGRSSYRQSPRGARPPHNQGLA